MELGVDDREEVAELELLLELEPLALALELSLEELVADCGQGNGGDRQRDATLGTVSARSSLARAAAPPATSGSALRRTELDEAVSDDELVCEEVAVEETEAVCTRGSKRRESMRARCNWHEVRRENNRAGVVATQERPEGRVSVVGGRSCCARWTSDAAGGDHHLVAHDQPLMQNHWRC